VIFKLQT